MPLSYVLPYNNSADSLTYNFNIDISAVPESSTRFVFITFGGRKGTSAATVSSVTINGITASIVVQQMNLATNVNTVGIAVAYVPTGTTSIPCSVVWSAASALLRCGIDVFVGDGAASIVPVDTGSSITSDPSFTLTVPSNGFVIGVCATVSGAITWTGLTKNSDRNVEGSALQLSAASALFAVGGNIFIQSIFATDTNPVMVAASFQFANNPIIHYINAGRIT